MVEPRRAPLWAPAALLVAALTTIACSPTDSDASQEAAARAAVSVTISASGVWGSGRATSALLRPDGSLLVRTTQGVYAETDEQDIELDASDALTASPGPIAVSAEGGLWAVATEEPVGVDVHHEATTRPVASTVLVASDGMPVAAPISQLRFVAGNRMLIETPTGPFVADMATPTATPTPIVDGQGSARSAVLPDGTIVTGSLGTPELAVATAGTVAWHTLPLPQGETVLDVDSSPDGSVVAVTAGIGPDLIDRRDRIVVLDAETLAPISEIETGVALALDEWTVTNDAVVVGRDTELRVWGIDGSSRDVSVPVDSAVSMLLPLGEGLLTVHDDGAVIRWHASSWQPTVVRTGTPVSDVTVSTDRRSFVVVDRHGAITVHDATTGRAIRSDERFADGEATALAMASDGRIGVASSLGEVTILDRELDVEATFAVTGEPADVSGLAFSPGAETIVAGVAERVGTTAFDDTVRAWDARAGTELFHLGGEREDVAGCSLFINRVRYSPDGRFAAITSHDFSVIVLDSSSGVEVTQLAGDTTVLDMTFTPDGEGLIAAYDNGMVKRWSVPEFDLESSFRGAQGGYFALAVVGETRAVAADITGSITLIDLDDGTELMSFAETSSRTTTLATSPDGTLVAAPAADGGVSVWSTADGSRLASITGHTASITGLAFSPSGTSLATASRDGTLRTWALSVGR